uniref:TadE/TadG family type IV pilus assembly protein n=1 Tax=Noviherbaspirillum sp. TaxID=1926288 RepID=UPI002FDF8AA9
MKRRPDSARGGAAVEFLLCLPLLLLLAFPVVDLARVLQANAILVAMSREGANLASRTRMDEQTVMAALAATAPPLDMRRNGSIRITRIL